MKQAIVSLGIILSCFLLLSTNQRKTEQYDVCIYGGTSAGVIAAFSPQKWVNQFYSLSRENI